MMPKDNETRIVLCKTPLFERCFADLREKGGTASEAAARIDVILSNLLQSARDSQRAKFRYTRNGEYRIKHCRKISLGCGYRLVFIQKDCCYVFLYAGSHDDCLRWIERNKGLSYELDHKTHAITIVQDTGQGDDALPEDVLEARKFAEHYEQNLMKQLDEDLLVRLFSGWCGAHRDRDCNIAD